MSRRPIFAMAAAMRRLIDDPAMAHAMGAAGALELAGNLPSFADGVCHATINLDRPDPECELPGLVANQPREAGHVQTILNNSFGMLGINSVVIISRI